MFRGQNNTYIERVDVIGSKGFIAFVDLLEKDENIELDTFQVGKDKLVITTVAPDPEKADKDITLPKLSPILARKRTLADEIAALDVASLSCPVLPKKRMTRRRRNSNMRAGTLSPCKNWLSASTPSRFRRQRRK